MLLKECSPMRQVPQWCWCRKQKNFNDNNDFAGVAGATVTIEDGEGNSTVLDETDHGHI